jgi:hypothetical protein
MEIVEGLFEVVKQIPMPSIIDDVADVVTIAIIFSLTVVLSYLSTRVIVSQMSVAAGR